MITAKTDYYLQNATHYFRNYGKRFYHRSVFESSVNNIQPPVVCPVALQVMRSPPWTRPVRRETSLSPPPAARTSSWDSKF